MQKSLFGPLLALALGAAGFGLRKWELATAFEPSGLVTPGMPATIALIVLSVLAAAAVLFLARSARPSFRGGFGEAFAGGGKPLYMGGIVVSALLLAAAAVLEVLSIPGAVAKNSEMAALGMGRGPFFILLLPLLIAVLALVSAGCILSAGRKCYRGLPMKPYGFQTLAPAYLSCLWLVAAYQRRAADPVVQDYIYELLAIICVLLALYYMAGFSFDAPKTGRTIFFSLLAVYFCMVTLADSHSWAAYALYGFSILYLLTCVSALLSHSGAAAGGKRLPNEHETEGNPNE